MKAYGCTKAKNIYVLEALHFANKAWNNSSDVTIRNCFCHGGFIKTVEEAWEGDGRSIETQEDHTDKTYEDCMDIDRDLHTSLKYSKDQIWRSIVHDQPSATIKGRLTKMRKRRMTSLLNHR